MKRRMRKKKHEPRIQSMPRRQIVIMASLLSSVILLRYLARAQQRKANVGPWQRFADCDIEPGWICQEGIR
jgi:hypothetical protein